MQEILEILNDTKWEILKEISKRETSATELAEKLDTSISNITQQLKILEAYEIIKRRKIKEKNIGKPRTVYSIKNEIIYAIILKNNKAEKKIFKIDAVSGLIFNTLFITGTEDAFFILKFMLKHEEILKRCKAIGFIKSTKENVELFILTDYIDEIRAKFSNLFIEDNIGKTKKIINWTHNEWEINDGLNRKDKYFLDITNNVQTIYDPDKILENILMRRRKI
ncbi:MAG: hypothetical protein KatS3mg002_1611 [Candidatus Woesearchaeota archaeon]|nr:MAG: hypothetical protein KatS3mg002_1611 [Candidatus Woesearchaeota archaeon]